MKVEYTGERTVKITMTWNQFEALKAAIDSCEVAIEQKFAFGKACYEDVLRLSKSLSDATAKAR